jgi:hypothetical protein
MQSPPLPSQRKLRFTFLTLAPPPPSHTIVPSLPAHLLLYASNSANPVLSTPPMQNVDQPKDKSPDHPWQRNVTTIQLAQSQLANPLYHRKSLYVISQISSSLSESLEA